MTAGPSGTHFRTCYHFLEKVSQKQDELSANRTTYVIVFTCRPEDYVVSTGTRRKPTLDDKHPPVRSVDLSQFIERWGTPGA